MTTLVALHKPGFGTIIGSDMRVTSSTFKTTLNHGKWALGGEWAIGAAGSLRMINVLMDITPKMLKGVKTPMEVTWRLLANFESLGIAPSGDREIGGPNNYGHQFMLASADGVWDMDSNLSLLGINPGHLFASGSGAAYALGAGTASVETDTMMRVKQALFVAANWDPNTGEEVWTHHLRPVKPRIVAVKLPAKKRVAK